MSSPTPPDDDDLVPISVRLGEVVPPDDPEDWTRPLTWVAATGMLAAPLAAAAWFWLAPPNTTSAPAAGTWIVAGALAAGAVITGATQRGVMRALTGTLAAGLFAALVTVVVGAAASGARQVAEASPTVAHALGAALGGVAGAGAAALLAAAVAARGRLLRVALPAACGIGVAAVVVPLLFGR